MPERLLFKKFFGSQAVPLTAHPASMEGDFQAHDHDFLEIVVVCSGHGWHRSLYGEKEIARGDAFILQPGTWHAYRACTGLKYFNCCFGPELLQRELAWVCEDPLLGALFWGSSRSADRRGLVALRLPPESLAACQTHLNTLAGLRNDLTPQQRPLRLAYFLLLLAELSRQLSPALRKEGEPLRRIHPAVLRGLELLRAKPERDWTLAELAGELHAAPSYLVRIFKQVTGLPPLLYLARLRAERAAALLLRTEQPVAEIGAQVGWSDPNYFARRFRTHFGMSATAYRERFGGGTPDSPQGR